MSTNFDYVGVPDNYKCSECGKKGCKLWRQYNTFLDCINLLCANCAMVNQDRNCKIDDDGYFIDSFGMYSCVINSLVPAIPTEDNSTFWGYTSVPEDGVNWWKNLPLDDKLLYKIKFAIRKPIRHYFERKAKECECSLPDYYKGTIAWESCKLSQALSEVYLELAKAFR